MSESQQEIDALLAEVNALANEAVADIIGDESAADIPLSPPAAGRKGNLGALAALDTSLPGARTASLGDEARRTQPPYAPVASRHVPGAGPDPARILSLEVPVIVRLAERTMPLSEIMTLSTGAIIEFEKPADSELDLMINNECIGQGQAVKVGENFGLRVSTIGSVPTRIKAMGKP